MFDYKQTGLYLVKLYWLKQEKIMARTKTNAREKILSVADSLFYQQGIRAVGVDTIIAKSKVAKTTLYKYFPSKDDLVVAYLESRNQLFWKLLEERLKQYSDSPKRQLLEIFIWIDSLLDCDDNYGCPFLIVASEFPELDYPGHQVAIAHKQKMRSKIRNLIELEGIIKAEELSTALLMLIDGAFAERRLFGREQNRMSLEKASTMIIDSYLNADYTLNPNHK